MLHIYRGNDTESLFLDGFAGFIMTAAMNLLLLIFVGIDPQPKDHDSHRVLPTRATYFAICCEQDY